jgi:hypothetical protein
MNIGLHRDFNETPEDYKREEAEEMELELFLNKTLNECIAEKNLDRDKIVDRVMEDFEFYIERGLGWLKDFNGDFGYYLKKLKEDIFRGDI